MTSYLNCRVKTICHALFCFAAACVMILSIVSITDAKTIVGLDCYHNNEYVNGVFYPHYNWGYTDINNYSQFAGIITGLGGDTLSVKTAVDSTVLSHSNIFIIVDPDTTTETPNPKYISTAEINALDAWVQRGGVLMLLANNVGNCELTHLNLLSAKFGIKFNADTYTGGYTLSPLPVHPFFTGCDSLHIKDICTFTVTSPATSVLTLNGKVLMVTATKGAGTVFALGDPWLYNEYINHASNKKCGTNVMQWLFGKVPVTAIAVPNAPVAAKHQEQFSAHTCMYSINGREIQSNAKSMSALSGIHGVVLFKSNTGIVRKFMQ